MASALLLNVFLTHLFLSCSESQTPRTATRLLLNMLRPVSLFFSFFTKSYLFLPVLHILSLIFQQILELESDKTPKLNAKLIFEALYYLKISLILKRCCTSQLLWFFQCLHVEMWLEQVFLVDLHLWGTCQVIGQVFYLISVSLAGHHMFIKSQYWVVYGKK